MELAVDKSFTRLTSDAGTGAVALLFTDELRLRFKNFNFIACTSVPYLALEAGCWWRC